MPKNAQTNTQLYSCNTLVKIIQASLQQYMKRELPNVQAVFRKGRELEIKLSASAGLEEKQESSRRTSTSAFIDYTKAFNCVDHNNL